MSPQQKQTCVPQRGQPLHGSKAHQVWPLILLHAVTSIDNAEADKRHI